MFHHCHACMNAKASHHLHQSAPEMYMDNNLGNCHPSDVAFDHPFLLSHFVL